MANGDVFLMLIRCPESECAQREPQTNQLSRAQVQRMLDAGEDITVFGLFCGHSWDLTDLEKENLRKKFAAEDALGTQ
jgi:hypothetical protein